MNLLYLYLNVGSLIIPLIFSFYPKFKFHKLWNGLFVGIFIMMSFFIPWDVVFTNNGYWGFNDVYISGFKLFNLPIEEWLFFICIPYACMFTHYSLRFFYPKLSFGKRTTEIIYIILQTLLIITLWYNYNKWYSLVNFSYAIILLGLVYNLKRELLESFLPTFTVILIPFLIVNGVLTGSFIEDQVVWYDNTENLGIRIFTIPIEDSIYALTMLLTVFVVMEKINSLQVIRKR